MISTADLFDRYADTARTLGSPLRDFGGRVSFSGIAATVRCYEDNSIVKHLSATAGAGKVMVIDGGGSLRCALMGDMIAKAAAANGWEGAVIYGAVRDTAELREIPIGIKALGATPRKSVRRGAGEQGVTIEVEGVSVHDGDRIYCDEDGVFILAP